MPIYRDKTKGCWRFEFNRDVPGVGRIRTRKRFPKTWSRAQADEYDRRQTAEIYARATGGKPSARIDDAVALYLLERGPELKHLKRMAQELALMHGFYTGHPLTELPAVCASIRKAWSGHLAPATIRNRLRYLSSACRWGYKHHGLCEHDPADRVAVPRVANERQVYADRGEMLLIAQAAGYGGCREVRALVRIGFYTGRRISEILRCEVDASRGLLKLPDTKNGDPRWIPIPDRIRPTVMRYMPLRTPASTLARRWRLFRAAAGMPHLHFHDLRHSTASELINSSVDLYTVGAVLGHKSTQSTKRYAHLRTETLADALQKVGRRAA